MKLVKRLAGPAEEDYWGQVLLSDGSALSNTAVIVTVNEVMHSVGT